MQKMPCCYAGTIKLMFRKLHVTITLTFIEKKKKSNETKTLYIQFTYFTRAICWNPFF